MNVGNGNGQRTERRSAPTQPQSEHARLEMLKRPEDFRRCYAKGRMVKNAVGVLHVVRTGEPRTRVGLSVSKKLGKAVVRNRVKRRLRHIVRALPIQPGYDAVLAARVRAKDVPFAELERGVEHLFRRSRLIQERPRASDKEA